MAADLVGRDVLLDPERQIGHHLRMIAPGSRDAGGDHVFVAHVLIFSRSLFQRGVSAIRRRCSKR